MHKWLAARCPTPSLLLIIHGTTSTAPSSTCVSFLTQIRSPSNLVYDSVIFCFLMAEAHMGGHTPWPFLRNLELKLGGNFVYLSSKTSSLFGNAKIHLAASIVQILYAGFQVLASASLSNGASRFVFPVYRNIIAVLLLSPVTFFFERGKRPPLSVKSLPLFFLCGLIGVCINQSLFLAGIYYTSATFAATLQNLTPALTFGAALLFGMEKVNVRRNEGRAKVLGVTVCIGGAIFIALYQGPSIIPAQGLLTSVSSNRSENNSAATISSFLSWQLGALCLLGNCVTWAIWFMLQTPLIRECPSQLSAALFTYIFGVLQLFIIAVCIEKDPRTWASTFYSDLPAVLYGGFIASGLAMTLQGWCAHHGGPVLVAAYQPLQTVLVAILSSVFLQETFFLGSLIGGFFIIVGLYLVVWGKSRERRQEVILEPAEAESLLSDPLLNR